MMTTHFPKQFCEASNLLASLRPADSQVLYPNLVRVEARRGDVLFQAGSDVEFAFFPCHATLVSFIVTVEDGHGVETALIGREGAVGGIVSHGRLPAYSSAVVQHGGPLLRIAASHLEEAKNHSPSLRNVMVRYADCLLAQVFQAVACNAAHSIAQRAAKWLLAAQQRTGRNDIEMTQEQLAGMLGVGRTYVSRVITQFKQQGAVSVRRGRLIIQDRDVLNTLSCHCNDLVHDHFEEVLRGVYPDGEDDNAIAV